MMHYGLHVIRVNVGTLIILPRLHFLSAFLSPAYLYSLIPPLVPLPHPTPDPLSGNLFKLSAHL